MKIMINIKRKLSNGTCPRTPERTAQGQHRDTNNNDNNIYLYLLNKYARENRTDFSEYIKTVSKMKNDPDWEKLNWEEQQKLISEI